MFGVRMHAALSVAARSPTIFHVFAACFLLSKARRQRSILCKRLNIRGMLISFFLQPSSHAAIDVLILRVPTTQLAKMSIDLKFVKLTADVLEN